MDGRPVHSAKARCDHAARCRPSTARRTRRPADRAHRLGRRRQADALAGPRRPPSRTGPSASTASTATRAPNLADRYDETVTNSPNYVDPNPGSTTATATGSPRSTRTSTSRPSSASVDSPPVALTRTSAPQGRLHAGRAAARLRHLARHLRRHAHRVGQRLRAPTASLERQQDNAEAARVALDRATPPAAQPREPDGQRDHDDRPRDGLRLHLPDLGPVARPGCATACRRRAAAPRARHGDAVGERERGGDHDRDARRLPGHRLDAQPRGRQASPTQAGGVDRDVFRTSARSHRPSTCPASTGRVPEDHQRRHEPLGRRRHDGPGARAARLHERLPAQPERGADRAGRRVEDRERARVLLNGSGSTDPEGRTLEYFWFEDTAPTRRRASPTTSCTRGVPEHGWQGVTFNKTFDRRPRRAPSKTFYLLVRDPGCLTSLSSQSPSRSHHDRKQRLHTDVADEQGWVLVSAIVLTLIMLVDRASSPRA